MINLRILFSILLAASIGTQLTFVTSASVIIPNVLSILTIVFFFTLKILSRKSLAFNNDTVLYMLFWLGILFTSLYSTNENAELVKALYLKILFYPLLFLIVAETLNEGSYDWILPIGASMAIPVNLFIYLSGSVSYLFPEPILMPEGRFMGSLDNPNLAALVFFFSIVTSLWYLTRVKSKLLQLYLSLIVFGGIPLLIATASKKGILLIIFIIIWFIPLCIRSIRDLKARKSIIGFALVILVIGISQAVILLPESSLNLMESRIESFFSEAGSTSSERGGSSSERLYFVQKGIEGWNMSPLWGHGAQSFSQRYGAYSHNNYVELLYTGGVILFGLYYIVHSLILIRSFRYRNRDWLWSVSLVLVLLFMDFAVVSYLMKISLYWICFAAYLARETHREHIL